MQRRLILLCAVLSPLSPMVAQAEPDETIVRAMSTNTGLTSDQIRRYYNACDSGGTLEMKICANYRWRVQDARLNKIYKQALTSAKEAGRERPLVRAQRAWLTYRDASCTYEGKAYAEGGTAEGLFVLSCMEELTKQRADRLEASLRE